MSFTKYGAEIFRDYATDGVPSSGAHRPSKAEIRAWMGTVETYVNSVGAKQFGAVMDGTTDDTAALVLALAVVAASGGHTRLVIDGPCAISAPFTISTSDVQIDFEGDGELIVIDNASTGPATFTGGVFKLGSYTSLTSRTVTASAARNDTTITLNDVTGISVGNLLRIDWVYSSPFDNGFTARVVAVDTGTKVVTLSHGLPYAISSSTALSGCYTGAPVENVRINNPRISKGSYTGSGIAGIILSNAYKCQIVGSRTTGCKGGGLGSAVALMCRVDNHIGLNDGGAGTGGTAGVAFFGATQCLFDLEVNDSTYFPMLFTKCHQCIWVNQQISGGGNLADTSSGGFARAWKTWGCTDGLVMGLKFRNVVGVGPFVEARTQRFMFLGVEGNVIKHNTAAAQGFCTNGMSNTDIVVIGLNITGTDTASGGSDIAIGSSGGTPDSNITFIAAKYDTIVDAGNAARFQVTGIPGGVDATVKTVGYYLGGTKFADVQSNIYTSIYDPSGVGKFRVGNASDPTTYCDNTTHKVRSADGLTSFTQTDANGFGYATGQGGTVTQATSKSTGVTLNKTCGQITMNNAALAAATTVAFTLTNSLIAATDVVLVNIASAATSGAYTVTVTAVAAGSCRIEVRNNSGGSLSEALVLNFAIFKAKTS